MRNGRLVVADFTEDTVALALESFLAIVGFPRARFQIEPFSRAKERWLGADARLVGDGIRFSPFYMQFKRPSAYPENSKAKIILDRKKQGLSIAPHALFFELREKHPRQTDYQHNVLFKLRRRLLQRNLGDAAYVCPLFLDRSAYRFHVHIAGLAQWPFFWRTHPWAFERILLHNPTGSIHVDQVPVLSEHICIPPHATVTSADHRYSFTESGDDLCFHSPEALPEGSEHLSNWLLRRIQNKDTPGSFITSDSAMAALAELSASTRDDDPFPDWRVENADDGIAAWLSWGDYLKRRHSIEQFAIVQTAE